MVWAHVPIRNTTVVIGAPRYEAYTSLLSAKLLDVCYNPLLGACAKYTAASHKVSEAADNGMQNRRR